MRYNAEFFKSLNHLFGPWSSLQFVVAHLTKRRTVKVLLRPVRKRIICRPWTGDFAALRELFNHGSLPQDARINAHLVVDLGANVGYATLLLKSLYPKAHVISVEPDAANYAMLKRNCGHSRGVSTFNFAVSDKNGWLCVADEKSDSVSRRFDVATEAGKGIRSVTMQQLLSESKVNNIDVIKIDIEGAEKYLFEQSDLGWLDLVKVLIIEFHGSDIEASLRSILAGRGFIERGGWGDKYVFTSLPSG